MYIFVSAFVYVCGSLSVCLCEYMWLCVDWCVLRRLRACLYVFVYLSVCVCLRCTWHLAYI